MAFLAATGFRGNAFEGFFADGCGFFAFFAFFFALAAIYLRFRVPLSRAASRNVKVWPADTDGPVRTVTVTSPGA